MNPATVFLAAAFFLIPGAPVLADNIGITPDQINWRYDANRVGTVTLEGDPSKPGPYVIRYKVPPHHADTPHLHPRDEEITVISGQFGFGLGPVFDQSKGRVLPPGSFFHLPANTMHFGWTGDEGAVIQAHGIGPFP
jgi:hypothetical protein